MAIVEKKFVWVDMDNNLREFDPNTGEGPVIELCRDHVLLDASEASEVRGDSGVVRAYLGIDRHWHLDGKLTTAERRTLGLWRSPDERDAWAAR